MRRKGLSCHFDFPLLWGPGEGRGYAANLNFPRFEDLGKAYATILTFFSFADDENREVV